MNANCDFNWSLVVGGIDDIELCKEGSSYRVKLQGSKIYPLDVMVPLIYENEKKCVGMVKINSFSTCNNKTEIEFDMTNPFDKLNPIAIHYYNMHVQSKEENNG